MKNRGLQTRGTGVPPVSSSACSGGKQGEETHGQDAHATKETHGQDAHATWAIAAWISAVGIVSLCACLAACNPDQAGKHRLQSSTGIGGTSNASTSLAAASSPEEDWGAFGTMLRPPVPVTTRKGAKVTTPEPPGPVPDTMLVDRRCTLKHDSVSGWYFVDCPAQDSQPAISLWALPNGLLAEMEDYVASRGDAAQPSAQPPTFRISGRIKVYKKLGHILLTKAALENAQSAASGPASMPAASATHSPAFSPSPSELAATNPAKEIAKSNDLLKALMKDTPGEPILPPVLPVGYKDPTPSVAPASGVVELDPGREGDVTDRVAYIVPEGASNWFLVRFYADNTLQEPPLRLLPCTELERANKLSPATKKYRISGELSEYKGRRYLLLRKVQAERDMGQL
jgi:hypothetical protein